MKYAFDTSVLVLLLDSDAQVPGNPETGKPVEQVKERIDYMMEGIEKEKHKIIVPTPVLGEILEKATAQTAQAYCERIQKDKSFEIVPFDILAAIEVAELHRTAWKTESVGPDVSRQKVKVDKQILAICKVHEVKICYTDDQNMQRLGEQIGIQTQGIAELPLPRSPKLGL